MLVFWLIAFVVSAKAAFGEGWSGVFGDDDNEKIDNTRENDKDRDLKDPKAVG
jgi:hypothetical protein